MELRCYSIVPPSPPMTASFMFLRMPDILYIVLLMSRLKCRCGVRSFKRICCQWSTAKPVSCTREARHAGCSMTQILREQWQEERVPCNTNTALDILLFSKCIVFEATNLPAGPLPPGFPQTESARPTHQPSRHTLSCRPCSKQLRLDL